jgi:translation initiation factor IF-3
MINEQIHVREVRLMGVDREPLGVVSIQDALAKAEEANLDLVMIAPQGEPPVCRIMDYSKYRFEQAKKEKQSAAVLQEMLDKLESALARIERLQTH